MSIVYKNNNSVLLDHSDFVNKLYRNIQSEGSYEINNNLFSIQSKEKHVNRKRTHDYDKYNDETHLVKLQYEKFISELPTEIKERIKSKYPVSDISEVRDLSKRLFEATVFYHSGINGGNNSNTPLKCKVNEDDFLIPENSRFFSGCVKEQCKKLEGTTFDVVIADPPWWNKYIRRLKSANDKLSYSMMYNEDVASIPVKNLLSPNCLVAVWCTNAPSNIEAVKTIIFPQWGVTYLTTWYWLKVTVDLKPLCTFGSGCKKQPYERIMLGKVGDVQVPDDQLIVSVPSALHSHKPPLLDVVAPYIKKENPQTLELFARYLLPNTTSVGYEPLKWQHISLYNDT